MLALTLAMEANQYKYLSSPQNYLELSSEYGNNPVEVTSVINKTIYIAQGLYGVDTTIVGIKLAVLAGSIGVLLLSLSYYVASYKTQDKTILPLSPNLKGAAHLPVGHGFAKHPDALRAGASRGGQGGQKPNLGVADYEYTQLILLSTLGMLLLVSSKDLISLYLSIELISLSLYILAGIKRDGQYSTEASIKYFLLGAVSSGLLLFGSALMY